MRTEIPDETSLSQIMILRTGGIMILDKTFFSRDCTQVAPDLIGKVLVRRTAEAETRFRITETEAYRGEEDTACHAHKGRTPRTEVLYMEAGTIYVYFCYGIHWLLNVVTGKEGSPQAVLIRACAEADGPAKLTKSMGIDKHFNRRNIAGGDDLWIEDDGCRVTVISDKRVGIAYASIEDQERLWRFKSGKIK